MQFMKQRPNFIYILSLSFLILFSYQCLKNNPEKKTASQESSGDFQYIVDRFADLQILRFQAEGFKDLSLKQKVLAYYLTMAGYAGRDITWDQNYKFNLTIRKTLEEIVKFYPGDRNSDDFKKFMIYVKRVWFSNGIHHHYSNLKFVPECSKNSFAEFVKKTSSKPEAKFPLNEKENLDNFISRITPIIFDPNIDAIKVNLDPKADGITDSAVNFYQNLTKAEAEKFYKGQTDLSDPTPISYGLNANLVKGADGKIFEQPYKVNGLYGKSLAQIVYWLNKAIPFAETEKQKESLKKLILFYETGDLKLFDEFNILWVQDVEPIVDFTNGFIEVYSDPLGKRGTYEALVSIKDLELTKKFSTIGENAQYFEDNSPIDKRFKKEKVTGVSYKVVTVISESGESSPPTAIGVNLPNAEWIRNIHGSKSVSLRNIEDSYSESAKDSGVLKEFFLPEQQERIEKYTKPCEDLSTGLHEVIGHASGKLADGAADPSDTLQGYASALEEGRADLVALYYIGDQKLVDLGVSPTTEIMKAEYDSFVVNGLFKQTVRIKLGEDIQEAHMRNRQFITKWAYEKGKGKNVIEKVVVDGKTYFKINDYTELRNLFGQLLKEVQRIKSEGDFKAGKDLIENYGVKIDPDLHKEALSRWEKLDCPAYSGFINPELTPIYDEKGEIKDITISYPKDFTAQMLYYSQHFSFL